MPGLDRRGLPAGHGAGGFSRDLELSLGGFTIPASSAPSYGGDPSRVNPEQLLVAALSACQALTYLALAAGSGIRVVGYADRAEGQLGSDGERTHMSQVTLHPRITIGSGADRTRALALVAAAHERCFIGNSVSTAVTIDPAIVVAETDSAPAGTATSTAEARTGT